MDAVLTLVFLPVREARARGWHSPAKADAGQVAQACHDGESNPLAAFTRPPATDSADQWRALIQRSPRSPRPSAGRLPLPARRLRSFSPPRRPASSSISSGAAGISTASSATPGCPRPWRAPLPCKSSSPASAGSSRKPRTRPATRTSGSGSATSSGPTISDCGATWRYRRRHWGPRSRTSSRRFPATSSTHCSASLPGATGG